MMHEDEHFRTRVEPANYPLCRAAFTSSESKPARVGGGGSSITTQTPTHGLP